MTTINILLVLASALIHSSWNFFTKRGNFPIEFFFWVFVWGVLFYLPFFVGFGLLPAFLLNVPGKLLGMVSLSGIFETIYFVCLIRAYQVGDLSLIYPISRSAPLFALIWALLFLGETLSVRGATGIGLVMAGLFVISSKGSLPHHAVTPPVRFYIRPYVLALSAAISSSVYSVIDKAGVQIIHPVYYLWLTNLSMTIFTGCYLLSRRQFSLWRVWQGSKREILIVALLQNVAYLLVLMALRESKVSYVVAFRQVGALFGAGMGILFLKESHWKGRMLGAIILTSGLVFIGLAG